MRGFLEISQNKLPKRAFRARLLPNFIEQCFQNERFARCLRQFSQKKASKTVLQISQNNASKTSVSHDASDNFHRKNCVWPQSRAIDPPNPTRGFIQQKQNARIATAACHPKFQNARFTTAACAKMYESSARRPGQPAAYKNQHFTTVSDVRPARSDERVARASSKFAFHHSFGCPMSMKRREGCERTPADSHFTTVLGTRRARSDERVARAMCKIRISPQFSTSDEHEVTRGLRRRRANFACHHSFGRPTSTK